MKDAAETVSKILGAIGAVLALAGYVLLIGAAILWLRLHQAGLPPGVPVSLASHEELIVMGAQAIAVWVALLAVFVGLAAWIVTGDPAGRRFGYREGGLALAVALSVLYALDSKQDWPLYVPGAVGVILLVAAITLWPSVEIVTATLLPIALAAGLGAALAFLDSGNELASSAGVVLIFGGLVVVTPMLQRWRARQEATPVAAARLRAEASEQAQALAEALEDKPPERRPAVIVWTERVALGVLFFLVLGVIAVTSQVSKDEDFNRALVSLTNGDCLEGSYVARGKDQLVIAQPDVELADAAKQKQEEADTRVSVVPVKEILDVQVYGESEEGSLLESTPKCEGVEDVLVRPPPPSSGK